MVLGGDCGHTTSRPFPKRGGLRNLDLPAGAFTFSMVLTRHLTVGMRWGWHERPKARAGARCWLRLSIVFGLVQTGRDRPASYKQQPRRLDSCTHDAGAAGVLRSPLLVNK